MNIEELKKRLAEIGEEIAQLSADLEGEPTEGEDPEARAAALTEMETRANTLIKERAKVEKMLADAEADEKRRKELADIVARGAGEIIEKGTKDEMNTEKRNSPEYIKAFADYIKTGDDTECRALLTENTATGTIAVPDIVDGAIRTAWDKNDITSKIKKSHIKGNVKIGYEDATFDTPAGSAAVVHKEGAAAVAEETLKLGIAELKPETIKKWIKISDEVLDMDDGAFVEYIYSELAYKIVEAIAGTVVDRLLAQTKTGDSDDGVPAGYVMDAAAASTAAIIAMEAYLCDEATEPVLIMDKATKASLKAAAIAANYAYDPFDGYTVITAAKAKGNILLTDLRCVQANFPVGEDIKFKFDDVTLATEDMVRIIGRLPVAVKVVQALHSVKQPLQ